MRTIAGSSMLLFALTSACSTPRSLPPADESSSTAGSGDTGAESDATGGTSGTTGTTGLPSTTSSGTDDGGDATGSSGDGGSSGAVEMPCAGSCTDAAFGAWAGPVVVHRADADGGVADCDGEYGSLATEGFTSVSADPASCGCSCGDATGTTCNPVVRRYGAGCAAIQGSYVVEGGECVDIPDVAGGSSWRVTTPAPEGGACQPALDVDVAPPSFGDPVRLCAPSGPGEGSCESGFCAPTPDIEDEPMCYWHEGDVECPAGQKTLIYDGTFDDTRDCGACECGSPEGDCVWEYASVSLALGADCFFGTYLPIDQCTPVQAGTAAIHASNINPEVSCSPSGGQPMGEVTPTGVITMCCVE